MSQFNPVTLELIEKLKKVIGEKNVQTDPSILDAYKTDEEGNPVWFRLPEVVVFPGATEEVASIVKLANEYKVPITPRSAGTSVAGGDIPVYHGIVMVMTRMNKIIKKTCMLLSSQECLLVKCSRQQRIKTLYMLVTHVVLQVV